MFLFREWHHQPVFFAGLAIIVAGLLSVISGLVHWSWLLASWAVLIAYIIIGRIGYHSLFSHRSYKTYRLVELVLLFVGTTGCYGSTQQFRLAHAFHHRHSDTEKDPYNFPNWRSVFLPSYVPIEPTMSDRKRLHLALGQFWEHRIAHRFYWLIVLAFASILFLISPKVAVYCWALPAATAILVGRIFNYLAHDGMTGPKNIPFWALLMFSLSGEHLHENHHRSPGAWDYREKPSDWDPGAYVIWAIMKNRPKFSDFFSLRHKGASNARTATTSFR
jgi:fatty-acid desaturase